jgi:hypothetical protein
MKTAQDHKPKKPTKAELESMQKQLEAEQLRQAEFIQKYNALVQEYGYQIIPQISVIAQKVSK